MPEHTAENDAGCCTACNGRGAATDGPCGECYGTGHVHPDHTPLAVVEAEGIPFVRCSCDPDGVRPQSSLWLREHWCGDVESGIAAIKAVIAHQSTSVTPPGSSAP